MISMGIGEIQKNIAILNSLKEVIKIVDKRRKKTVAIIYPATKAGPICELRGKYKTRISEQPIDDLEEAKAKAMMLAMEEKYGLPR